MYTPNYVTKQSIKVGEETSEGGVKKHATNADRADLQANPYSVAGNQIVANGNGP